MIAEYGLREALLADPVIAGLVGSRSYPHDAVPQKDQNADAGAVLTYQRFDIEPGITLDGEEDPTRARVQFNCLASTATAAAALGLELRRFFRGGAVSVSGFQLAKLAGGGVLPRDPDSELFGYRIDVLVTLAVVEAAA